SAIARKEGLHRFRMREIQAAFPCQQKLSAHRRHGIVQLDGSAGSHRCFRRHESGRSAADYHHRCHQNVTALLQEARVWRMVHNCMATTTTPTTFVQSTLKRALHLYISRVILAHHCWSVSCRHTTLEKRWPSQ